MTNPLLDTSGLPLFDRIAPEHVAPAMDELLAATNRALETVTAADFPAQWVEIAKVLDTSVSSVKSLLFRARTSLRSCLQP